MGATVTLNKHSTLAHPRPSAAASLPCPWILAERQPVGPNETGAKNTLQRSKDSN